MDILTQEAAASVADDVFTLPAWCPIPGLGILPMNSFLIRGREPTLVDAGPGPLGRALLHEVEKLIDLDDLRWVWLTHTDPDHVGAVQALIERAPRARFVTSFLGAGKLALHSPLPAERTHLLEIGGRLDIGDRELVALRPPVYDAPETLAAFDTATATLFAADCFGALLTTPVASADDLSPEELADGMATWAAIDTPWLGLVERAAFGQSLRSLEALTPRTVLSAHLPAAHGGASPLMAHLARVRDARASADHGQRTTTPQPATA